MRPNALVFDYNEFPPVPEEEWEDSARRHALALASVLLQHVAANGFSTDGPFEDEQGAVIGVLGNGGITDIGVDFYPRDSDPDFGWSVQFRERKRLLRWLFGRKDNEAVVGPVKECVAKLVESQPTRFKNPEWLDASAL